MARTVGVVIFATDERGVWTYLSDAWTLVTGHEVAASLGRDSADFVHPEDRAIASRQIAAAVAAGTQDVRFEHRYLTAGGEERWVEVNAALVMEHGAPVAVRGAMTDVTARRRAQTDLRRQQRFTDAVLETVDAGIVACDEHGTLTLFNRATRDIHGLDAAAVAQDDWADHYDLFAADGRTPMAPSEVPLVRAFNGEQVRGAQLVIAPAGRAPRALVAHGRPLYDEDGRRLGAVVAMHDVTDQRQLESDLRSISEVARLVALNDDARGVVVEHTLTLTGASMCMLWEPDAERESLQASVASQWPGDLPPAIAVSSPDSGAALAYRTGRAQFFSGHDDDIPVRSALLRQGDLKAVLFQPVALGDEIEAVLVIGWSVRVANLEAREAAIAQVLSVEAAAAVRRARRHRELRTAALRDPLTGLPNRRAWEGLLPAAIRDAAGADRPWPWRCWTSTSSRRSTTPRGTPPATSCCGAARMPGGASCAPATRSPAWAATSSPSCCPTAPPPTPRGSPACCAR